LPDFSWHNVPKRGKIHQIGTKLPNCCNILQMAKEYTNLFHSKASLIYSNWDFLVENMPSGKPALLIIIS
jgi:hypothetical protein